MKRYFLCLLMVSMTFMFSFSAETYPLIDIAEELASQRQYDLAIDTLQYLLKSKVPVKTYNTIQLLKQEIYYGAGHYAFSFDSLQYYFKRNHDKDYDKEIRELIIDVNDAVGNYEKVILQCHELQQATGKYDVSLLSQIANAHYELKQYSEAIDYYKLIFKEETKYEYIPPFHLPYKKIMQCYLLSQADTSDVLYRYCDSVTNVQQHPIFDNHRYIYGKQRIDTLMFLTKRQHYGEKVKYLLWTEMLFMLPEDDMRRMDACYNIAQIASQNNLWQDALSFYYNAASYAMFAFENAPYHYKPQYLDYIISLANANIYTNNIAEAEMIMLYIAVYLEHFWGITDDNSADYIYRNIQGDLKGRGSALFFRLLRYYLIKQRIAAFSNDWQKVQYYENLFRQIADSLSMTTDQLFGIEKSSLLIINDISVLLNSALIHTMTPLEVDMELEKFSYHDICNIRFENNAYIANEQKDTIDLCNNLNDALSEYQNFYTQQLCSSKPIDTWGNTFSSKTRELFHNNHQPLGRYLYSYTASNDIPQIRNIAYKYTLFNKQLLLLSDALIYHHNNLTHDTITPALRQLKRQLASSESLWERDSLLDQINIKERALASAHLTDSSLISTIKINSLADIVSALDTNEAAIEVVRYDEYLDLKEPKTMYAAFILFSNDTIPLFIPLCESASLKAPNSDKTEINAYYNNKYLYSIFWEKLMPHLKKTNNIYFCPDDVFYKLAIESCEISPNVYISDKFNIIRLTSMRNITDYKSHKNISHSSANLYGDITYSLSDSTMKKQSEKYRILRSDRGFAESLKHSKQEINNISDILLSKNVNVRIFDRQYANEESFMTINGNSPDILHLSTHGFYWDNKQAQSSQFYNTRQSPLIEIDAMSRSGLLLAGANKALQGDISQETDDGILTADEIAQTDLHNTQLVVLSACDTGLGDINSEGVYGLQRAFMLAGAKTIVMSLWKVDDEATSLLMSFFYEELFVVGDAHFAIKKAQDRLKAILKYSSPYYWASFIVIN